MKGIANWFLSDRLERTLGFFLTTIMFIALLLQVISRYVFNMSLIWTEEVSLFAVVWLAYIGASLAVIKRKHLRIDLLVMHLSPKKRKIIDICCNIVFFAMVLFLTWGTFRMTALAQRTGQVAAATGWPRWVVIAGMPCAFGLMSIRLIQDTLKHIQEYQQLGADGAGKEA